MSSGGSNDVDYTLNFLLKGPLINLIIVIYHENGALLLTLLFYFNEYDTVKEEFESSNNRFYFIS